MSLKEFYIFKNLNRWFEAANLAIEGILFALKTERHLKFHFFTVFHVLFFCFILGLEKIEFVIIILISLIVIMAEMFNTSIEKVVNLITREKNHSAKVIKDIAAGAVLIACVVALIIGYLILYPYLERMITEGFYIARHKAQNIGIFSVILVILIVIFLKTFSKRGALLIEGFPSGRASISFSIFTTLTFYTHDVLILSLLFFLACMITFSGMKKKIYKFFDVLVGAILGSLISYLLFVVFY